MVICTIWQSHYNNQGALKYRCSIYNYENHPLYRWKNMAETCSSSCIQLHTWYHSSQCIWISLYVGALENPKNFRIGFTPNNMHKNAVCTFFKWGCLYSCKFLNHAKNILPTAALAAVLTWSLLTIPSLALCLLLIKLSPWTGLQWKARWCSVCFLWLWC